MFSCAVGREEHCKQISLACACSVWATLGLPLLTALCAFPGNTAQAPGCSAGELSKAGSGLHALPRSKLLRLRFSDISQRHRLGWACILCPSQVQGAQVTRCLASALSQCVVHLITSQLLGFLVALQERCFRCVSSGGLISGCDPPGRCQPSRIPGRHG